MSQILSPEQTVALVVGIEKYDLGDAYSVDGPANCALSFVEWLRKAGVPAPNITLFLSPREKNTQNVGRILKQHSVKFGGSEIQYRRPTEDSIRSFITQTLPAQTADLLLIYWNGHGCLSRGFDDRRLLCGDAVEQDVKNIMFGSVCDLLRSDRISRGLKYQAAFVDACADKWSDLPNHEFQPSGPRADIAQFVLYSTSIGQTARVVHTNHGTPFTDLLIQKLTSNVVSLATEFSDLKGKFTRIADEIRSTPDLCFQKPVWFDYRAWDGQEELAVPPPATEPSHKHAVPYKRSPSNDTRPTKNVLIIAVNPDNTEILRLDREVRDICRILKRSAKIHFIVEVRWAVRFEDLQEILLEFEPDHVHFCGHGSHEEGILLKNSDGMAVPIGAEQLAGYFSQVPHMESALFLTCYSEEQTIGITNVDIIVGVVEEVNDDAARTYAVAYYKSIAAGESSSWANERGRHAVRLAHKGQESVFVSRRVHTPPGLPRPPEHTNYRKVTENSLRILFAAANPIPNHDIQPDEEIRAMYQVVEQRLRDGSFSIEQNWALRFSDLHESLLDFMPHVVHLSALCADGKLLLEDEIGKSHAVPFEAVSSLLRKFSKTLECIVLTTSYSDTLAGKISEHCQYLVAMPNWVTAKESLAFTKGFYRALARGYPYQESFDYGCIEMKAEGITDDSLPRFRGSR